MCHNRFILLYLESRNNSCTLIRNYCHTHTHRDILERINGTHTHIHTLSLSPTHIAQRIDEPKKKDSSKLFGVFPLFPENYIRIAILLSISVGTVPIPPTFPYSPTYIKHTEHKKMLGTLLFLVFFSAEMFDKCCGILIIFVGLVAIGCLLNCISFQRNCSCRYASV